MIEINSEGFLFDSTKPHLGGNYPFREDSAWCEKGWQYLISKFGIRTALDLGGGYGFVTKWMLDNGIDCKNIDGLQANIDNAVVPNSILHDLTEAPLTHPPVDFVNCIEVVEHIEEQYLDNLMKSLILGNIVFITHARPGQVGYHHVNCQTQEYWIEKFENYGHIHLPAETSYMRATGGWHIKRSGLVFKRNE